MKREIAALKAETGASGKESDAAGNLKELEAELAALKERYADDHPDIQRLRRSIAALNASDAQQAAGSKAAPKRPAIDPIQRPDNPAYVALTSQLESTKRELAHLAALRDDLRAKQRTYDCAAAADPGDRARVPRPHARLRQRPDALPRGQGEADAGRGCAGAREGPQGRALQRWASPPICPRHRPAPTACASR